MIATRLAAASQPERNTYVIVTFNPWLYQDFEGARSALLQIVGDEVFRHASANETLKKKAKRLLGRINLLRLTQLGGEAAVTIATGIPVGMVGRAIVKIGGVLAGGAGEGGPDEGDKLEGLGLLKPGEPISLPQEIHAFREALEELLAELKITLVVFVDDLDRCLPATAISTLESIRLLLFLKRSAFVVAADNEFIRGAVRVHFKDTGINDEVATNYFDKLIQVPLHVPRLGVNEAKAYLALLLLQRANADTLFDNDLFERALKAVPERLQTSWRGDAITTEFLTSLVGAGNDEMLELMKLAEGLAPMLTQSTAVNANPRLMKRFLNTVFLRAALAEPQGIKLDIPALAKWHLVERCDESLANTIAAMVTSATDGRVDELRRAEEAAGANSTLPDAFNDSGSFVREWLQLSPPLGETDLRPLLHLSRDTATRDFGADNLSMDGRNLRDALLEATQSNKPLTGAIRAVPAAQAEMALSKAWQLLAPRRTWKNGKDIVPLVEVCKVHPEVSAKAASLLGQAPIREVGAGLIPTLWATPWARPIVERWLQDPELPRPTKNAIEMKQKDGLR